MKTRNPKVEAIFPARRLLAFADNITHLNWNMEFENNFPSNPEAKQYMVRRDRKQATAPTVEDAKRFIFTNMSVHEFYDK